MFYEFKHPISADYFTVETGVNFSFPAHIHHNFELVAVTEGKMTVSADGKDYELSSGEAVLLFPNQIHSLKSTQKSSHILCIFSPNLVSAYTAITKSHLPEDNRFVPDTYLLEMLKNTRSDCDILEKKGLLYSFVSAFHKVASYRKAESVPDSLLYGIFRFIEDNYRKSCSLAELAKSIGYEYTYISRYFKKFVGMSYNDYVNEYRISRVCYLLTNTDKSVLEISEECGFNSLRSLNRNFKERLGCSPVAYRCGNAVDKL